MQPACQNEGLKIFDVPALSEALPGYEASAWFGIGAPKRTPEKVIERLNDFAKLIYDEVKMWSRVILAANIKPRRSDPSIESHDPLDAGLVPPF
jgi:tripartite-type tricarboxylate transporter receptor subunit TctC